ncbi:MAG: acyl-CoA synthetase FdrA [Ardenticatenia bacterium]|nr:acyl-CoA synthetase FdrA [Ardenticatenia bacterium]
MTAVKVEIRSGAYYDSVILMQLQSSLADVPGVLDTGVIMGTDANKEILAQSDLLVTEAQGAAADDLVIVLRAEDEAAADAAMAHVDGLLTRKRSTEERDYLPKSLETAADMLPEAQWVLISVPGRYAAGVAREALRLGKHAFLFSDNVSLEDEVSLKRAALEKGLFVMGPDCGTAIVNGVGLGFANRVRRGPIGMVAASGTGLQQVSCRIHQLGSGLTHGLGTGGRDLSEPVCAITARQGVDFFSRDPDTKVIVLVSKPPAPKVAEDLLKVARASGKPVVVDFIGYTPPAARMGNLHFVRTFDEAAALAVQLAGEGAEAAAGPDVDVSRFAQGQRYLRGLFSGGTLAYEALLILQDFFPTVYSNAPLKKGHNLLKNSLESEENTIVDLGEDEFTVGRLHPMMDNALRIQRLHQEADDPEVAVILLDVVLGYGSHPDPASELAPAISEAIARTKKAGRHLEVVAVVVGTDEDPQGMDEQIETLRKAGAWVETRNDVAVGYVGQLIQAINETASETAEAAGVGTPVDLDKMNQPLAGINAGLESFAESIEDQDARAIQVDWRPPAGGNEKMAALLERMKQH